MVLENLEPSLVWEIFEEVFTATPRESKKEDKIRKKIQSWVKSYADDKGVDIEIVSDEAGNLLLRKSATKGMEKVPSVLMQGHMDMVCETVRPEGFDFDNEPIPVRIQDNGEWVEADRTTLGADNGIGVSLGLALMLDPEVAHGPLELLITVDEETGLVGAFALDPEKMGIESRLLLNLDSEDLGVVTIGSAGGGDTDFSKKLKKSSVSGLTSLKLEVKGLFGGHSGVDIHLHRANANKMMARMLADVLHVADVYLAAWEGGDKHNAIPREAMAAFGVPSKRSKKVEDALAESKRKLLAYYQNDQKGATPLEPDMEITWSSTEPADVFNQEESRLVIWTVNVLPHGPQEFSPQVEGLVETSNNVAAVKTEEGSVSVLTSTRSSVDAELDAFRERLREIATLAGWDVDLKGAYPGWKPEPKSPFLKYVVDKFKEVRGKEPVVKAIHAGLECGIIGSKIPGIQMLSVGPDIKNAHTPDEKLKIEDVTALYDILKKILADLNEM
ncbi:aminoacyl-histidine dipeptidase [Candidatus Thorarchaeota archaeon]|nr:MAG: aminoacyl-histidine dipeptidase [Candidatus Thorarchaeota archaeon]